MGTSKDIEMTELYQDYKNIAYSRLIDERDIDVSVRQKHIATLQQSEALHQLAITIYDNYQHEHVYVSDYHHHLFADGEMVVHPDDLPDVMKNVIATLKHIFNGNKNVKHLKMVREYRAKCGDTFRRVTESMLVLETDKLGNAWLVLCVLEISPNQAPPFTVNSHIVNTTTGEVFSPLTQYYKEKSLLSKREIEILSLIAQGKLSKEISDLLHISLNTANTHRQHILEKLGVDNSHEAVRYALSLGLIEY